MAIIQDNLATRLEINIQDSQPVNSHYLGKLVHLSKLQIQRFFWHFHAYGTIFGVMLLTLVSLIYLTLYWFYRRFFTIQPLVETNAWDATSSN